jgi:predicted dehydrogenase
MLEKPMCVTTEEALEIIAAEKKSGKILSIGFQPRMDANMQKIKEIVQSGELGKVYYIQTGGGRRRGIPCSTFIEKKTAGIGAMGDIGCYSLDMVLNAIGYPKPLTVTGYKSNFFGTSNKVLSDYDAARFDVEDFAAGFVRLEGDIVLDFRISWAMHMNTSGDALILGTKGGLRIPSTDCWNGEFDTPLTIYKTVCNEEVEYKVPMKPSQDVFFKKLRSFVDAIQNGDKPAVPSSEIVINQAIIDGIVRSAALGKEISIEIPEV